MKVIDAVWEQRNLGVSCNEITIEKQDTAESIKLEIPKYQAQYMVVKVPACRADIMFALSELQFAFVECAFHVTHDLKNYELNGIQKRLVDAVQYSEMDKNDLDMLFTEIRDGMFTTDRVCLDPYFTQAQAANRYVGWISDELERGSQAYKLTYKDNPIGFFTFKDLGNGVYYPYLAGMYKNGIKTGLGLNTLIKPISEAIKRSGRMLSTYISSNNLNAVHVHTLLNFKFQEIDYVYVKHNG